MANILEMAKNIHPTHTLSEEELASRYIEIYPSIKREIEFFIEVYPQTSAPLFVSGQIGSGKSTLLKRLYLQKPDKMVYFDIHELTIKDPKNSLEISALLVEKILQYVYPDTSISFESFLTHIRGYDPLDTVDPLQTILEAIQEIKNKFPIPSSKIFLIDGLDRFVEISNNNTVGSVLLDHAKIWEALECKLLFVTPLFFTQSQHALTKYKTMYPQDFYTSHLTLPLPDPLDLDFWKRFITKRAKLEELHLTDEHIQALVAISGGVLRGTLIVLRHLLNFLYREGEITVHERHLQHLRDDVTHALERLIPTLSLIQLQQLRDIGANTPSTIPSSAVDLFTRDIPLAIFTERNGSTVCIPHPLLNIQAIADESLKKFSGGSLGGFLAAAAVAGQLLKDK